MKNKLSRREFLQSGTAVLLSTTLTACGVASTQQAEGWQTATPAKVLQSPMPPTTPEPTATLPPDSLALEKFLMLSAVLTGIPNLNPEQGRIYLRSLASSSDFNVSLTDLYEQANLANVGAASSLTALEEAGIFAQEGTKKLADKIIEYWYTGTYTNAEGETAVATYADALAWKVLDFTKPPTICGAPYFWAERPSSYEEDS